MKKTENSAVRLVAAVLVALCTCMLAGCGVLGTYYASFKSNNHGNDTTELAPESNAFLVEMAHKFGLMALFAEVVYRRDIPVGQLDARGCEYLIPGKEASEEVRFGMPQAPRPGRWKRWIPPASAANVRACENLAGLYYETYVHENGDGKIDEAVIAYRGTENRWGQYWYDWSANAVAALGFEPNQYAMAGERLQPLIKALLGQFERDGQRGKIYAVGHSLGGGLAQQAGFLSKDIAEVFTFNTSPVTNWSHLRLRGAVRNAYPTMHRVYHGGEILEKLRFVTTSVTQARYGRHDIGLQFEGRTSFGGHGMKIIACNFAQLLAAQTGVDQADHHYPLAFVREVVLSQVPRIPGEEPICLKKPPPATAS